MRLKNLCIPILGVLLFFCTTEARRVKIKTRPVQPENDNIEQQAADYEEDSRPQAAIQYYSAEPQENSQQQGRLVLVSSDDDYNGPYGQPTIRQRADYNRPAAITRNSTPAPRTKDQATKAPPVQTIRNYSKVNDDGSFTFGYEAADGSFKEETRGTDCVVRGKYGYVDPDGNKREFTYVSGNPCDPNNPDSEEEPDRSEEESNEPENIPQNYPKRIPVRQQQPQSVRPIHTTARPTTVFQNNYAHHALQQDESEEEEPEPVQYIQPQRPAPTERPIIRNQPQEVSIRERPRITYSTTPTPATVRYSPSVQPHPVNITPRPTYRAPTQTLQTQPPATTYRPALAVTQKPAAVVYTSPSAQSYPSSTPSSINLPSRNALPSTRRPIDFAAEFQKFQDENQVLSSTTPTHTSNKQSFKASLPATSNPIYHSQLIFDPSTGQYDSNLYQQLPQTDGEFELNHRIQPYVHQLHQQQHQQQQQPQLVSLEQLQQQNPLYRQQLQPIPRPSPISIPQFSQQVYQKSQDNLQVLNSQQLFAQQQELAQQQLQQDRIEAAKKNQNVAHRFQVQAQPTRQQPQAFYYVQPAAGGSLGQIDAFLRGQNIEF